LALTGEQGPLKRTGGTTLDGSGPRRPIYASIAKVSSILGVSTSFL
jgi:hypothetical protein